MPNSAQKSNFCHTTPYEGVCKGSGGKFQAKKVFYKFNIKSRSAQKSHVCPPPTLTV